ncbi:type II secretion system minor pseudopilin GspJ [Marinomonas fungiae]|uniref:Type II secretion system protein J n=1 Tax=Marinomonas fungiae TaxID=1137284 RepID=A0A0K6IND1_9GAMM|nr:type II secretion system minor pseudopilin GspJ [Marinomonas fungiae]CUB04837.1 type II secretion system protein J [Marinomonas fungiae]
MSSHKPFLSPLNSTGFTLVELLVVVLIMAIMGTAAYDMLGTSMRLESRSAEQSQEMEQLTRAFYWLQQDAEQYIDRPIRDELGEFEPSLALQGKSLSLTHLGWANPLQEQRSTVQRVTYQLINGELRRMSWRVLDRTQDSKPLQQILLSSVQDIEFAVLSNTGWQPLWPQTSSLPGAQDVANYPVALRIRLTSRQFGTLERLFELPSLTAGDIP